MPPSFTSLLFSAALAGTGAAVARADLFPLPDGYNRFAPLSQGVNWNNCTDDSGKAISGLQCGRFEVPLDWHNSTAGKGSLAVVRHPAAKQPKLGTIFFNPGGPGESGTEALLLGSSQLLMEVSGGQYDIVSWDPRGVGSTIPRAECFKDAEEFATFWEGTIPLTGLEARGNLTDQRDLDEFYAQVGEVDTLLGEYGKRCIDYSPGTFQYIGTTAVVRDMVALHDLLEGQDKLINYWGISYGTAIGSYFINMFPDRVGRVVLDGVLDPVYYANRPAHEMWRIKPESTDEAFTGFAMACAAAGPSGCAIAFENSTTESVLQWTRDLLDAAYDYNREAGPSAEFGSASIRGEIYKGMYTPIQWPQLAEKLAGYASFLTNASTSSNTTVKRFSGVLPPMHTLDRREATTNDTDAIIKNLRSFYTFRGITCGDAIDAGGVTTKDVFDFIVNVTRTVSPMFGPGGFNDAGTYCHRWPVRAVERFTGPWNNKLSNTVLIIGNEADPVTPYISAKRVADALGDSAILIEQDDYGHATFAMRSDCTLSAIKDYFVNNTLPSQDKFCGTNQVLFPGPGVTKNSLAKLAVSNTLSTSDQSDLQTELDNAKQRSRNLFIAVIALATATGLLLISLLFSCFRSRKTLPPTHATYVPRGAFEKASAGEEQGHAYGNPYAPASGFKAGGYSRVEA